MTTDAPAAPKPPTPEEMAALVQLQREREAEAIKNTISVINDGIEFMSKQTVAVGESRRISNVVDYLNDLKRDFKKRLAQITAEGKQTPPDAPPAAQNSEKKPELAAV